MENVYTSNILLTDISIVFINRSIMPCLCFFHTINVSMEMLAPVGNQYDDVKREHTNSTNKQTKQMTKKKSVRDLHDLHGTLKERFGHFRVAQLSLFCITFNG